MNLGDYGSKPYESQMPKVSIVIFLVTTYLFVPESLAVGSSLNGGCDRLGCFVNSKDQRRCIRKQWTTEKQALR
jgi:hypothetical protein